MQRRVPWVLTGAIALKPAPATGRAPINPQVDASYQRPPQSSYAGTALRGRARAGVVQTYNPTSDAAVPALSARKPDQG